MKLISWNVRGINSSLERGVTKGLFQSFKGECLFLQETKLDAYVLRSICPWSNCRFVMCPLVGASGVILLVWNTAYWYKLDEFVWKYSVSALLKDVGCDVV